MDKINGKCYSSFWCEYKTRLAIFGPTVSDKPSIQQTLQKLFPRTLFWQVGIERSQFVPSPFLVLLSYFGSDFFKDILYLPHLWQARMNATNLIPAKAVLNILLKSVSSFSNLQVHCVWDFFVFVLEVVIYASFCHSCFRRIVD